MGQVAGTVYIRRNGTLLQVKGSVKYNLGRVKREAVVGIDRVHGNKGMPQVPFIECTITDTADLDLADLVEGEFENITAELANGKNVALRDAWFAGSGDVSADEGEIEARWEGLSAEEY